MQRIPFFLRSSIPVILVWSSVNAQTASWTKFDRDNIYSDVYSYLGTNYKQLSNDQKETISLCFLDEVTSKYTKEAYQAKIEIELKRIRNSVIDQCAKNHGVNLAVAPEPVAKTDTPKATTQVWDKKAKDEKYYKIIDYMNKVLQYKNLTADQKSTVSLCYVNELTSKYTPQQYADLMEVERSKITKEIFQNCLVSNNIDTSPKVDDSKPSIALLKGHWKDSENYSEFWLNDGNSFTMIDGGKRTNGIWTLYGNTLTLTFDRALFGAKERNYKILMFTPDKFAYQAMRNLKTYTVEKVK